MTQRAGRKAKLGRQSRAKVALTQCRKSCRKIAPLGLLKYKPRRENSKKVAISGSSHFIVFFNGFGRFGSLLL